MTSHESDSTQTSEEGALAEFYEEHENLENVDIADSPADLGERISEAMERADQSSEELAIQLGVPAATVAAWQVGEETPSATMINRVAGMLGASLSWMLIGEGSEPREASEPDGHEEMQAALDEARQALRQAEQQLERVADQLAD